VTNPYYTPVTVGRSVVIPARYDTLSGAVEAAFDLLPASSADFFRGLMNWTATDSGAANAYAVSLANVTAYSAGLRLGFIAANTNTGASTLNVSSLGAIAVTDMLGTALQGWEIVAGDPVIVIHDGAAFRMLSRPWRSRSNRAVATEAAALAGSDNTTVVTPLRLLDAVDGFFAAEARSLGGDMELNSGGGLSSTFEAALFAASVDVLELDAYLDVTLTADVVLSGRDSGDSTDLDLLRSMSHASPSIRARPAFGDATVPATLFGDVVSVSVSDPLISLYIALSGETAGIDNSLTAQETGFETDVVARRPVVISDYTMATLPSYGLATKSIVFVSDGDNGNPCLAVGTGSFSSWTRWPVVNGRHDKLGLDLGMF
jgi:hypothetical protein